MKKLLSILVFTLFTNLIVAQVYQTANVTTPGTLYSVASSYLSTVTNLTVTGTIDVSDFKTMRDNMPLLSVLDISGVSIAYYQGPGGSYPWWEPYSSNVNELPICSFYNGNTGGKTTLTSIKLPNSCTSIGYYAFYDCSNLTNIIIPNGISSIGGFAFVGCNSLTQFIVESGNSNYSTVDGVLFNKNQTSLIQYPGGKQGSYTIPGSVTSIGDNAFYDCNGLTVITIGSAVNSIGTQSFVNCSNLTRFNVSIINTNYSEVDGVLFNKNQTSLIKYPGGMQGSYTVPNTVTSIGDYAFLGCGELISITIPNSVISLGSSTFNNCTALTSILIGNGLITNGYDSFRGCPELLEFNVQSDNQNFSSLDGVLFDKNQSTLLQYPPKKQGSYIIPNTVTSIGDSSAFFGSIGLTSITFPISLTYIWCNFHTCTSLKTIYCLSEIPPSFSTDYIPSVTDVFVPSEDAVTTYRNDAIWISYFPGNIIKNNILNGLSSFVNRQVNVYTTKNKIIVDGTCIGETVTLYTVNGKQLQSIKSKGERLNIQVEKDAVYLVKTEEKTFKVIL